MKFATVLTTLTGTLLFLGCQPQPEKEVIAVPFPATAYEAGMVVSGMRHPEWGQTGDSLPSFSWQVPVETNSQSAYRIWVASSKEKLSRQQGDLWDSGKVTSPASSNIVYGGQALHPGQSYFWQVRIWDVAGIPTEYSPTQRFTLGAFNTPGYEGLRIKLNAPAELKAIESDHYFIDFGKDAFGTLALYYPVEENDTLTIRLGEKLDNTGRIDRDPPGSVRYQLVQLAVGKPNSNFILQLPPDSRNTGPGAILLPDSIGVVMPFRYVEIENSKIPLLPNMVRQRAVYYDFDAETSQFKCSDTTLNKVWDLCKYTIEGTSFAGIYVDGDRERIPYEADAYINQLSHYQVDREYSLARRTIIYLMDHPTWPTEWQLHMAMMIDADYQYTGNKELIQRYYQNLKKKCLMDLAGPDGLISSLSPKLNGAFMAALGFQDTATRLQDIVDWPPAQKDTGWPLATPQGERDGYEMMPENTVVNAFYYRNLEIMESFARILGKTEEAEQFHDRAVQVRNAFSSILFDSDRGVYLDGAGSTHASLHSNMMPLAFGLVPAQHIASVVNFIKKRGLACSVYGAQYLLESLYQADEDQYALNIMRNTSDRGWWHMSQLGSTMTLEAWDLKYKPNADWNHAWGTAPANIIARYMWGIRPETPGFETVRIEPKMSDLTTSLIELPTLRGTVKASFARHQNGKTYVISIPPNTQGLFVVREQVESISVDNQKVTTPEITLTSGVHKIDVNF